MKAPSLLLMVDRAFENISLINVSLHMLKNIRNTCSFATISFEHAHLLFQIKAYLADV